MNKIFEPKNAIRIKEISELNIAAVIEEIYTLTPIHIERKNPDGSTANYNLIPKALQSLKVLAELPILVVLMYQLFKTNVQQDIENFIPAIIAAISLQPAPHHRSSPAFNKEVYVDFMAAQIKTLSFLAYMVRLYQEPVTNNATQLTQGFIGLLANCPPEVAHLRKELLIAARHIMLTELRRKFVPCISQLFDENIVIGPGWTAQHNLRPLAYSTVADLVHHVRHELSFSDLLAAVNVYSKNVHDDHLPTTIHTMSCKLLLNLAECIRQKAEAEPTTAKAIANARELLAKILEVFVLKLKNIARHQLPVLMNKHSSQQSSGHTSNPPQTSTQPEQKSEETAKPFSHTVGENLTQDDKAKFGFPPPVSDLYSVSDCKSLVKTLVLGVKTVTWNMPPVFGNPNNPSSMQPSAKPSHPKETNIFIRMVKYALASFDIYTLVSNPSSLAVGKFKAVDYLFKCFTLYYNC